MPALGTTLEELDRQTRANNVKALAARFGMTTADTLPPKPKPRIEYVDETPRRQRRCEDEIRAEAELDHHFVTLLSVERPTPRFFGDNRGMLPVWVEANADWRQAGAIFDRQQPALRAIRLSVMALRSNAHAARLKAAIDEALHGREQGHDSEPLRHRFSNAVDFGDLDVWWTPLLQDALMRCELAATDFEIFSRADHERMVAERVASRRPLGRSENHEPRRPLGRGMAAPGALSAPEGARKKSI